MGCKVRLVFDCIIAGAGPVGLYTAGLLEGKLEVLVLEEHGRIGRPSHCSGLISRNLERFVRVERDWIENEVRGAVLHSPYGREVRIEKPGTAAFVINRERFDQGLGRGVSSRVALNSRLLDFDIRGDCVKVKTSRGTMESKMLIGCDGSNSLVAGKIGSRPREVLNGLMATVKEEDYGDFVELWFDKSLTDGFLWRIPRGSATEYGGLGSGLKFGVLEKFFRLKRYEKRAGPVPIGPGKSYSERILLIGDAAGQTKPWSGGGVIYGLTCAGIAAGVLERAFETGDFSGGFLKSYENAWKRRIGRGIAAGLMFRKIYKRLGNRGIETAFRTGKNLQFLMNRLDMDFVLPGQDRQDIMKRSAP